MSKIGRNDPCTCQSGKKYKKCCYHTNNETLKQQALEYRDKQIKNDLSEKIEGVQKQIDELVDLGYYEEPKSFDEATKALDVLLELDRPDSEDLFYAFETLYGLVENHPHLECYLSLVTVLKDQHPNAYQENQKYFLHDSIESLLILGQYKAINELIEAYAQCAADDITTISRTISLLILYDLDDAALTLHRLAWSAVYHSEDIFSWAKEHFKTDYYRLLTIQELVNDLTGISIFNPEKFPLIGVQQEEDRAIYTNMRKKLIESSDFDASCLKQKGELLKDPVMYQSVINNFIRFLMKKCPDKVCAIYSFWNEIELYLNFLFNNQIIKAEKKSKNWNILYPRKKIVDKFIKQHYIHVFETKIPHIILFLESLYYWVEFLFETHILEDVKTVFEPLSSIYESVYDQISHPLYGDRLQKLQEVCSGCERYILN